MNNKLAINGGDPLRKKPFKSNVVVGKREKIIINQVLESKEFSRFMGAPSDDIENLLVQKSSDFDHDEKRYFSFLGGRMVRKFEADFAEKFDVPYAISVNSATSGLSAALGAIGVEPEDEVITTCLSFSATAASILLFNAIPVFVDVDPKTFCMDPFNIEKAITEKTKAILVVHLLGFSADMNSIMKIAKKYNLKVIEDSCQGPLVKFNNKNVGTIGDIGVFSFNEPKNIQTGEGGMVVTHQPELAKRLRLIRNHGESVPDSSWDDSSLINIIGMNYRMTELTAALGIAQLTRLDKLNSYRIENSNYLSDKLKNIEALCLPDFHNGSVPHVYPIIYNEKITEVNRDKILTALKAEGIPVGSGYLRLMYENPLFLRKIAYGSNNYPWTNSKRIYSTGDCPIAEELIKKSFIWFYHIHYPNTKKDMNDVVKSFNKVFNNLDKIRSSKIQINKIYKW